MPDRRRPNNFPDVLDGASSTGCSIPLDLAGRPKAHRSSRLQHQGWEFLRFADRSSKSTHAPHVFTLCVISLFNTATCGFILPKTSLSSKNLLFVLISCCGPFCTPPRRTRMRELLMDRSASLHHCTFAGASLRRFLSSPPHFFGISLSLILNFASV
jgi:hypothetical protein